MFLRPVLHSVLQPLIGLPSAGGLRAFSPLQLFAAGEQGGWYDPSDFSTQFQDSAGTTPVTAVGQPVGKVLDKSGNGNHLVQATPGKCPVLQQSAAGNFYWALDGVDDGWQTAGNINLSATDKVSLFVGALVTSVAGPTIGMAVNHGGTGFGHFSLQTPTTIANQIAFVASGATGASTAQEDGLASPFSGVMTGLADIAANSVILRRDGVQRTVSAAVMGAGNFVSGPFSVGMQTGGTLRFFNGRIYQVVVRGAASNAAQLSSMERYIGARMGIVL